jgi:hypothetical protein
MEVSPKNASASISCSPSGNTKMELPVSDRAENDWFPPIDSANA